MVTIKLDSIVPYLNRLPQNNSLTESLSAYLACLVDGLSRTDRASIFAQEPPIQNPNKLIQSLKEK